MSDEVLYTLGIGVVMVVGLFGVFIPVVPGLALIVAAALVYGLAVGFGAVGTTVTVLLVLLLGAGVVVGLVLPKRAADAVGAPRRSQLFGLAGAVVGFFVIPFVGAVVGALLGVLVAEAERTRDWGDAARSTIGLAKGFGVSALIQFGLGSVMIALWSVWAFGVVF